MCATWNRNLHILLKIASQFLQIAIIKQTKLNSCRHVRVINVHSEQRWKKYKNDILSSYIFILMFLTHWINATFQTPVETIKKKGWTQRWVMADLKNILTVLLLTVSLLGFEYCSISLLSVKQLLRNNLLWFKTRCEFHKIIKKTLLMADVLHWPLGCLSHVLYHRRHSSDQQRQWQRQGCSLQPAAGALRHIQHLTPCKLYFFFFMHLISRFKTMLCNLK